MLSSPPASPSVQHHSKSDTDNKVRYESATENIKLFVDDRDRHIDQWNTQLVRCRSAATTLNIK